ncbi:MAG: hypothetical protein FJ246_05185 [Nitrospira sp.]|nr:hypothetical protein [Nitrospira sp.]
MTSGVKVLVLGVLAWGMLAGGLGCAGAETVERKAEPVGNPVLGLLNKDLIRLNVNIEQITKRITDLQGMPESADPTLRELRGLDLSGAQLHKQQWILQRDQLAFAKEQVNKADDNPSGKSRLLEEWRARQQQFEAAADDLRQQRHALERKRGQVEARLVDRALQ